MSWKMPAFAPVSLSTPARLKYAGMSKHVLDVSKLNNSASRRFEVAGECTFHGLSHATW